MKILAIETSCDDTGVAILEVRNSKFKVLSNIVSSQTEIHKKYGGVFPMMAKREHQTNLVPVLARALKQAKLLNPKSQFPNPKQIPNSKFQIPNSILKKEQELLSQLISFLQTYEKPDVDLIAVTNGPGLEPCLWVGINFAKALSYFWDIPIVAVNHIEAHILVNFLPKINKISNLKSQISNFNNIFPVMALVVSGGHTQLILMNEIGDYRIIGETRDDAAGECFDKCAKILGLGYPGGPIISKIASEVEANHLLTRTNKQMVRLPRPMMNTRDHDFSFSGLKTAVLYAVRDYKNKPFSNSHELENGLDKKFIVEMCFEIQQAIIDVLIKKTIQSAKDYKAKTIILGGGVSANQELRQQLKQKIKKEMPNVAFIVPDASLSTDNALMIAIAGFFHKNKKISWKKLKADANLRIGKS